MYELYRKVKTTKRTAPSKISINKDYDLVGEVEAFSRGEAARKWYSGDLVNSEGSTRSPVAGDVIKSPTEEYFILTPIGLWASVLDS